MRNFLSWVLAVLVGALAVAFAVFQDPVQEIETYWVITPIAFVAAALANATAVGGGFLFVPLFIYAYGLPATVALKLTLATQAFGMTAGAVSWSKKFIEPTGFMVGAAASVCGMVVGTLAFQISSELVKPIFAYVSLIIFALVVLEIRYGRVMNEHRIGALDARLIGYALTCVVGGLLTAWTGIAIGELAAVYLLFAYGLRIETAVATGVALLAVNSVVGLILHSQLGGIPWTYLMFTAPGVLLGGYAGATAARVIESYASNHPRLSETVGRSPVKVIFSVIILVDGVSILAHTYYFN